MQWYTIFPCKGPVLLKEMASSRSGVGNIQDEPWTPLKNIRVRLDSGVWAPTGQGVTIDHQKNDKSDLKHVKHVIYGKIHEFIMILKAKWNLFGHLWRKWGDPAWKMGIKSKIQAFILPFLYKLYFREAKQSAREVLLYKIIPAHKCSNNSRFREASFGSIWWNKGLSVIRSGY